MHPAMVIYRPATTPCVYRLAQKHIIVIDGHRRAGAVLSTARAVLSTAPHNGTSQADLFAEYYCKKLAGKPVQYGGTAPGGRE